MPVLLLGLSVLVIGATATAGNAYGSMAAIAVVGFFWLVPLGGGFLLSEYYKRRGPRP